MELFAEKTSFEFEFADQTNPKTDLGSVFPLENIQKQIGRLAHWCWHLTSFKHMSLS
jgi:hypothetical protein